MVATPGRNRPAPSTAVWLSGRYRRPHDITIDGFKALIAHKFDLDQPGNQAKLAAVEQLSDLAERAGLSLTHLALAFAATHPAVSSVVLGPRTRDQLDDLLGAADLRLDDDELDRIDQIVAPGTNLNPADTDYTPPELTHPHLRRRAA